MVLIGRIERNRSCDLKHQRECEGCRDTGVNRSERCGGERSNPQSGCAGVTRYVAVAVSLNDNLNYELAERTHRVAAELICHAVAIARWAGRRNVPLIQFSADYVFDRAGTRSWRETDLAKPSPPMVGASSRARRRCAGPAAGI